MIKAFGMDIDGTMTDGGVYVDCEGKETLKFYRRDGNGISLLKEAGIFVFAITSESIGFPAAHRCKKLDIPVFCAIKNKVEIIDKLLLERNICWKEFAYIGDDINDLEVLKKAGISACPADAENEIIESHRACTKDGGKGAVREFSNFILKYNESLLCGTQ